MGVPEYTKSLYPQDAQEDNVEQSDLGRIMIWPENNTPDGLQHDDVAKNKEAEETVITEEMQRKFAALNEAIKEKAGLVDAEYPDPSLKESDGTKLDGDKLRLDLIDPVFEAYTAMALGFGAVKYGDGNWLKGIQWSRIYGALRRHLRSWYEGEEIDMESNNPHLAHAAAMLMMLCRYSSDPNYNHLDDRLFKREEYPEDLFEDEPVKPHMTKAEVERWFKDRQ